MNNLPTINMRNWRFMMKYLTVMAIAVTLVTGYAIAQDSPKRCIGKTVQGVQCHNRATDGDYCHLHSPNTPRCNAKTKKGTLCTRIVKAKGQKCWQHAGDN